MNIICTILAGIHSLMKQAEAWLGRKKISRKSRREKAVYIAGGVAVAALAFSCHSVHAQGKYLEVPAEKKEKKESRDQEDEIWGLDTIIQGVLTSQDTRTEVARLGTSFEVVLVGQRVSPREVESSLDFSQEGIQEVEMLQEKSIGVSEQYLTMSDQDYETLLKIVEAEAGGEDTKGKILVANVIFNRIKSPNFPSTVTEVVWQNTGGSIQFSPTADGRIHTVTVSQDTREAVNRAIDGEDYSQGALFFVEEAYADKDNVAWFKRDLKFLFNHGVHDFYTYP